jgi:hypothetical protein
MKRIIIALSILLACADETSLPPPPVGPNDDDNDSLPVAEPVLDVPAESTGEPELCPWSGLCADLEPIDGCDGWAVACGDGWRCVDTMAEGGIVCEDPESSSSGDPSETSSSGEEGTT